MRSVKAAVAATLLVVALAVVAALLTRHGMQAMAARGELQYWERVGLALANWYVRVLPFASLVLVGGAALVFGIRGAQHIPMGLRQERRAWLMFALVAFLTDFLLSATFLQGRVGPWWSVVASAAGSASVVACLGMAVTTIRIHWRARSQGVA
jgi:hypothetical protein